MPAQAYSGIGSTIGIVQGFVHPIGGLDHALAMIAVGFIAACIGGRARWLVPAVFIGGMVLGAAWGSRKFDLPNYETGIALSVVLLGVLIASGRNLPELAAAGLAGVFAIFHGYAHGVELPLDVSVAGYAVGFVLATALLCGVGIGLRSIAGRLTQTPALRAQQIGGGVIAAVGIAYLAGWL
jgi:urease accessory protein